MPVHEVHEERRTRRRDGQDINNGAVAVDDNEGRMDWGEWKLPDCNGKIGSVKGEREGPRDV